MSSNPRITMRALPRWMQPLLTMLTGRALPEQPEPVRAQRPWRALAIYMLILLASVSASAFALTHPSLLWVLPVTFTLTVAVGRWSQSVWIHHAAHGNHAVTETGNRWAARVADALSLLFLITPAPVYAVAHLKHHGKLAAAGDPDFEFLIDVGLEPGWSRERYWRWLAHTLLSPRFHLFFLKTRLRRHFVKASAIHRIAAGAWIAAIVAALLWSRQSAALAVAWVVPVFPLFHVASLLQLLTEHTWSRGAVPAATPRDALANLTFGRYVGEAVPPHDPRRTRNIAAWTGWAMRMCTVHAWQRLFVWQGDLPNHDWHHRVARDAEGWTVAAYVRDRDPKGIEGWPIYEEVWGLRAALDHTFASLAVLPATAFDDKNATGR